MNEFSLKLDERTAVGKKVAHLRQDGFVPSVVYGGKTTPLSTQSPLVETTKIVQSAGKHSPVHLMVDGKKKLAIIKSIDMDPVKHQVRHVAFHTIKQNETITTFVPIVLIGEGESAAEKAGLVVLQAIEQLEIKALPANLPESLEISIVNLVTHEDRITLADVTLPDGVEFADIDQDLTLVVANVYEPGALQAANEAAGGDAEAEDEVAAENGSDVAQDTPADGARPTEKK
jgi:large subunit ribosomal protein L25